MKNQRLENNLKFTFNKFSLFHYLIKKIAHSHGLGEVNFDSIQEIFCFIQTQKNLINFDLKKIILFINKLVCLIREKLDADIKKLFDNSEQFLHTIDELLTFSNQLVSFLDSTESSSLFSDQQHFYTCLHIICENQFLFTHWLSLEKQIWQKYLDEMFSNQSQLFCSNFNIEKSPMNNSDLKDLWPANNSNFSSSKSTKCAECFILIIKSIQDRYFKLPYPSKQLRFVSLQIDLLTDFHLRLCQILRDEANNIFSKTCLGFNINSDLDI
ncbi:RAD50-interacting 1 [Brachionus plicatilis]|uniref:RAD50-interacting 1 n=1 Tax=Brachionus plicatilis TaxID=10195 RepID=A0A3M7QS16_BRAPC|nr:RAD50-interacting 1 [Brachionus plicatilis]